jgi:hypothetical protein
LAWWDSGTPAVIAYLRGEGPERILMVHNLSAVPREVVYSLPGDVREKVVDILAGQAVEKTRGRLSLSLQPYEYRWLLIH